ncbi:unnamed protein product [Sphagnum tenellum]
MSPLFGNFGLVPFFSVPPFGFCCCWPSMARSAKYLHTTQKQFRTVAMSHRRPPVPSSSSSRDEELG